MMFLLLFDVTAHAQIIGPADSKRPIACLPTKRQRFPVLFVHPKGGTRFQLPNEVGKRNRSRRCHQDVCVVACAIYGDFLRAMLLKDAAHIREKRGPEGIIDRWATIFRPEDDMHQQVGKRVSHAERQPSVAGRSSLELFGSYGAWRARDPYPTGSASLRLWARMCGLSEAY